MGFLLLLMLAGCMVTIQPPTSKRDILTQDLRSVEERPADEAQAKDQWCASDVRTVKVLNPRAVAVKDEKARAIKRITKEAQVFQFGDSCLAESGGWWESLSDDTENDPPQVLVRYWSPAQRSKFFSCPSQVIFFVTAEEWGQRCKPADPATTKPSPTHQQEEKTKVQQLLKEAGK